jgi:glycosyltransferase involved in cell wall biosynthesis
MASKSSIAVLIPCKDEAISLGKVVERFRAILPEARIYVGNNASTDRTEEIARELGCIVVNEVQPGKGNMVRKLLRYAQADYYFLIDGDNTYEIEAAVEMLALIQNKDLDSVIAKRVASAEDKNTERTGHLFGNRLINSFYNFLFKSNLSDVLSGYRLFSDSFVKTFPANSSGFEIEVELSAHANLISASVLEVDTSYSSRSDGSESKLRTFRDGFRIVRTIFALNRRIKPVRNFAITTSPLFIAVIYLFLRALFPYVISGRVSNFPSLILGSGLLVVISVLFAMSIIMEQAISNHLSTLNLAKRASSGNV